MAKLFGVFGVITAIVVLAGWWLLLDSRAPASAEGEFDIAAWRTLVADDADLPTELRIEIIGTDEAPKYAAETGGGFSKMPLYYSAIKIASPDETTIIGGAVDDLTAAEIAQSKDAAFNAGAYERLKASYADADQILITHEHLDHVMAITRHPHPETFVTKLMLTAPQIEALPQFAPESGLSPVLQDLQPADIAEPVLVAPGVVAAPAPGHTDGSLVIYVKRDDGREYLLIGDIVWAVSNIENLKTRPRLLQYLFFEPNENRKAILRQVRALHDLAQAEPNLIIVPEHDGAYLDRLIEKGDFELGFE